MPVGTTSLRELTPVTVIGLTDALAVSVGEAHSRCAEHRRCRSDQRRLGAQLRAGAGGAMACWGHDGWGALGRGSLSYNTPTPVDVIDLDDAAMTSAGAYHTCAVRASGEIPCWGSAPIPVASSAR